MRKHQCFLKLMLIFWDFLFGFRTAEKICPKPKQGK